MGEVVLGEGGEIGAGRGREGKGLEKKGGSDGRVQRSGRWRGRGSGG